MTRSKKRSPSGIQEPAEFYRRIYAKEMGLEAEWLRRGASNKVDSIEKLLRMSNLKPKTILELGSGSGAVITECQHRNLAESYTAIDYSSEACSYLRSHSDGIRVLQGDITSSSFALDGDFDLVIVSHVLEHLIDPSSFLQSLKIRLPSARFILEVPLEDLLVFKLWSLLRDRKNNPAGHVQFFSVSSFRKLLASAHLSIQDARLYVPVPDYDTIRFLAKKESWGLPTQLQKALFRNLLPKVLKPIWKRLFYAHYAVLASWHS